MGSGWALSQGLLCLIYLMIWQRQRSYATLISLLASTAGMAGAALWAAGVENAMIVPWWGMFLVLTIVAERVELARIEFSRAGVEKRLFGEALLVYLTLPVSLLTPEWGYPLLGVTLAAVITDVACHDSARHTIRVPGLARFSATCLLVGYGWAAIAALIWVVEGPVLAGYRYDAVVHSLTLGFVMSMIFAHAPVIVPAIARKQLPYHPVMWVTWGILQAGLLLRIVAGIRQVDGLWQFAGTLNVVAVLAFLVTTFVLIVAGAQQRHPAVVVVFHSRRATPRHEGSESREGQYHPDYCFQCGNYSADGGDVEAAILADRDNCRCGRRDNRLARASSRLLPAHTFRKSPCRARSVLRGGRGIPCTGVRVCGLRHRGYVR